MHLLPSDEDGVDLLGVAFQRTLWEKVTDGALEGGGYNLAFATMRIPTGRAAGAAFIV